MLIIIASWHYPRLLICKAIVSTKTANELLTSETEFYLTRQAIQAVESDANGELSLWPSDRAIIISFGKLIA